MLEIRHDTEDRYSLRTFYERIYLENAVQLRDSFYLWIINILKPQPNELLLDISCGSGRLVRLARERGIKAWGVDYAITAFPERNHSEEERFWIVADGENLPFPKGIFNYATHIGSLEHYLNPKEGALEVARMIKADGNACVLLPNSFGLLGNIKHVMLTGDIFDDGQPLQRYGTRITWAKLLTGAGLKIKRTIGYGEVEFPRNLSDTLSLIKRPFKILKAIIAVLLPTNLANHFVFLITLDEIDLVASDK